MIIKNIYHKKLNFIIFGRSIGIESNEIVEVEDEVGKILLNSPWITENVKKSCPECSKKEISDISQKEIPENLKVFEIEKQDLKPKGRKKRKIIND